MDEPQHTPTLQLPLTVGRLDRGLEHYSYAVLNAAGKPIAEGFTEPEVPGLIVRACNSHDALLIALRQAEHDLDRGVMCSEDTCTHENCTLAVVRAAITAAAATEQKGT